MAEAEIELLAAVLRKRLLRFLRRSRSQQDAYAVALNHLLCRGETVALFGGAIRDFMTNCRTGGPRDLDLVVGSSDSPDLYAIFGQGKANGFGGLRVTAGEREIDVWRLSRTWAFHALSAGRGGFEDLPRTTFLNVEAIAVRLQDLSKWQFWAWDNVFFRAILDRMVEINLEDNLNPVGCVARSLVTACRLGFSLGPKLVGYLDRYLRRIAPEELVEFQHLHYGTVLFPAPQIAFLRSALRGHLQTRRSFPLRLFNNWQPQLSGLGYSLTADGASLGLRPREHGGEDLPRIT
jgi:hypothetical protein